MFAVAVPYRHPFPSPTDHHSPSLSFPLYLPHTKIASISSLYTSAARSMLSVHIRPNQPWAESNPRYQIGEVNLRSRKRKVQYRKYEIQVETVIVHSASRSTFWCVVCRVARQIKNPTPRSTPFLAGSFMYSFSYAHARQCDNLFVYMACPGTGLRPTRTWEIEPCGDVLGEERGEA